MGLPMRTGRKIKLFGLSAMILLTLGGCKVTGSEVVVNADHIDNKVFKIKEEVCTLPEARVVLTNYQNIYDTMYGIDLWDHGFKDNQLEKYVKDMTVSRLAQIMAMDYLAQENQVTLSEEEQAKVKEAAEAYFTSLNDAEKEYMQVKQGDIETLYTRYGLANKLYTFLTQGVNDEVSDEEARVMEAEQIFVSDDEKAKEVEQQIKEGNDFLTVANRYNEAAEIEVFFSKNNLEQKVAEAVFSLENDEVSKKIKTDDGYYFVKCINHYDQERTDDNKSVILEERRKEAFDDVYQGFLTDLPSEFNEELWDGVKVELSKDVTTDSFFQVYEKYCTW